MFFVVVVLFSLLLLLLFFFLLLLLFFFVGASRFLGVKIGELHVFSQSMLALK